MESLESKIQRGDAAQQSSGGSGLRSCSQRRLLAAYPGPSSALSFARKTGKSFLLTPCVCIWRASCSGLPSCCRPRLRRRSWSRRVAAPLVCGSNVREWRLQRRSTCRPAAAREACSRHACTYVSIGPSHPTASRAPVSTESLTQRMAPVRGKCHKKQPRGFTRQCLHRCRRAGRRECSLFHHGRAGLRERDAMRAAGGAL